MAKRKTHRKKNRKHRKRNSLKVFPQKGMMIIPDTLDVVLPLVTEFHCPAGFGTAGAMAFCNVGGSYILNPLISSGAGPTFVRLDAVVGGAGGGFGGLINTGYPAIATQTPSFYSTLFGLYRSSFVKGSKITVNATITGSTDECDLIIVPQSSTNDNAAYALLESRYVKKTGVMIYTNKIQNAQLSSSMTTRKLYGIQQPSKYLIDNVANCGSIGTNPTTYQWIWQVALANRNGLASVGTTSLKIEMKYYVRFFNPKGVYL